MSDHVDDKDDNVPDDWCLHITRTLNGYIACGSDGSTFVFEEGEDCQTDDDPHAMARLLYHVIEYFGAGGSRYDAERVRVVIEPGDKHGAGGAEIAN